MITFDRNLYEIGKIFNVRGDIMGKLESVVVVLIVAFALIGIFFMVKGAGWAAKYYIDVSPGETLMFKPGLTYVLNHPDAGRFKIRVVEVRDDSVDVVLQAFKGEGKAAPVTISVMKPGSYGGAQINFVEKTPGGFVRLSFA